MTENISSYFLSTIDRFFYSVATVFSVRHELYFTCNFGWKLL